MIRNVICYRIDPIHRFLGSTILAAKLILESYPIRLVVIPFIATARLRRLDAVIVTTTVPFDFGGKIYLIWRDNSTGKFLVTFFGSRHSYDAEEL